MSETGLRADAERNRQSILVAAETLFLERGASVSLDEVAKRAKVGIGTLYRRFPTREGLLAATSDERFVSVAEASRARDADREPGDAMRRFLEDLAINTSVYQSLAASLGTVIQHGTPGCIAITEEGQRLLRRAQDAGVIRGDASFDDVIFVVSAIALAVESNSAPVPRVAHLVDLLLSGMMVR
ncbi:helix-turn-helix domain-containing protein [Brevundimonas sp.]|uniref:TetR/AcrR family transcriptional regulator n=1 Tax=Brevundimonas sp. TaxID=1871086 RepID=UPI002ABC29EA|nr:helix-turn-helix domain-containing protein [Brevundimonas sp.]MDZ4361789.1 helix-turn-helix domain-containing protein [Brevundimonas sp.]